MLVRNISVALKLITNIRCCHCDGEFITVESKFLVSQQRELRNVETSVKTTALYSENMAGNATRLVSTKNWEITGHRQIKYGENDAF